MIFHENCLPADNYHEIPCIICYLWKSSKIWNCRLLQIIGGALWVNRYFSYPWTKTYAVGSKKNHLKYLPYEHRFFHLFFLFQSECPPVDSTGSPFHIIFDRRVNGYLLTSLRGGCLSGDMGLLNLVQLTTLRSYRILESIPSCVRVPSSNLRPCIKINTTLVY